MPLSDEDLMSAYASGDATAGAEIYKRYAPQLGRMIAARGAPMPDTLQQTFLQLHRARADFKAGARLKPWLFTIGLNLCREHYRRRRPQEEFIEERSTNNAPTAEASLHWQHQRSALHAALARLPDGQRDAIVLHWLAELPFSEVAVVLGITEAAAKVRAHRGYEALRKALEGV